MLLEVAYILRDRYLRVDYRSPNRFLRRLRQFELCSRERDWNSIINRAIDGLSVVLVPIRVNTIFAARVVVGCDVIAVGFT